MGIEVRHCTQLELFASLPNSSVEAIITDPPYYREYIQCYIDCYTEACRVLKPHGDLLMILPHWMLDPFDSIALKGSLKYRWTLAMIQREGNFPRLCNGHRNLAVTWKPIGWWYYPGPKPNNYAGCFDSYNNKPPNKKHEWEQSVDWANFCLDHLYYSSGLIVDPMCGAGTLPVEAMKRGYDVLCGDIDERAVNMTLERIKNENSNT